ncbi:hypothetical protein BLNAU_11140 [Blattamonas nauphoetae]|uniref:B box-type domain-containing protein n=1 Tax=Blattamonas nauphoetae TaxID=2049346 RepID=A0ABQ9XRD8_9EUKA|nr:hypothetical protein BLNAU_11140 [Blattamonas nauphoetae]
MLVLDSWVGTKTLEAYNSFYELTRRGFNFDNSCRLFHFGTTKLNKKGLVLLTHQTPCPSHPRHTMKYFCPVCGILVCVDCRMTGFLSSGEMALHMRFGLKDASQRALHAPSQLDTELETKKAADYDSLFTVDQKVKDVHINGSNIDAQIRTIIQEAFETIMQITEKTLRILFSDGTTSFFQIEKGLAVLFALCSSLAFVSITGFALLSPLQLYHMTENDRIMKVGNIVSKIHAVCTLSFLSHSGVSIEQAEFSNPVQHDTTGFAFVTFRHSWAVYRVLSVYEEIHTRNCLDIPNGQKKELSIGGNVIHVSRAPDPSDVLFENIGITQKAKAVRTFFITLYSLIAIIIGIVIMIVIKRSTLQYSSDFFHTALIAIVNLIVKSITE